jgi:hypothetical protein
VHAEQPCSVADGQELPGDVGGRGWLQVL